MFMNFSDLSKEILLEADKDVNKIHEFVKKRQSGARKIESSSNKKGGVAKLTAIHFAAKEKPYNDALKYCTKDDCEKKLKAKGDELANKLKDWDKMSQKQFQSVMGELEAYGEVYIRCVKPNSISLE